MPSQNVWTNQSKLRLSISCNFTRFVIWLILASLFSTFSKKLNKVIFKCCTFSDDNLNILIIQKVGLHISGYIFCKRWIANVKRSIWKNALLQRLSAELEQKSWVVPLMLLSSIYPQPPPLCKLCKVCKGCKMCPFSILLYIFKAILF